MEAISDIYLAPLIEIIEISADAFQMGNDSMIVVPWD